MMAQAFLDIGQSDFLIAETSDKGIGIGIEVGYARAKQKPIIQLRQATAEHSTTVSGTSNYQIIYTDTNNLHEQLKNVLHKIAAFKKQLTTVLKHSPVTRAEYMCGYDNYKISFVISNWD